MGKKATYSQRQPNCICHCRILSVGSNLYNCSLQFSGGIARQWALMQTCVFTDCRCQSWGTGSGGYFSLSPHGTPSVQSHPPPSITRRDWSLCQSSRAQIVNLYYPWQICRCMYENANKINLCKYKTVALESWTTTYSGQYFAIASSVVKSVPPCTTNAEVLALMKYEYCNIKALTWKPEVNGHKH